jgi:hypothetical protein
MRLARVLVVLVCVAALADCSFVAGGKLLAPGLFGLEQVTPELYVEQGADPAARERLRQDVERAREAVRAAFGGLQAHPVVHACITEACYSSFGGTGDTSKVYGERILLSPRGLDWHFIAHEWTHAELHTRLGLRAWLGVPQWFDEGLAVAVSEAPESSEEHWRSLEYAGVRRPTAQELREIRSRSDWTDAAARFGDAHNRERRARGEPELRPLYAAAGHEVRPWLRERGPGGLQAFIARMRAGAGFESAFATSGSP